MTGLAFMCPRLYAAESGLVKRALVSQGGPFDELSTLHALMTWLASDCGVDIGDFADIHATGRAIERLCEALGRALGPLSACVADEQSEALVVEMASAQKSAPDWLRRHFAWVRSGSRSLRIEPGALVTVPKQPGRHLVVRVEPTKISVYLLGKDRVVGYRANAVNRGRAFSN